jgi:hypothetical protein
MQSDISPKLLRRFFENSSYFLISCVYDNCSRLSSFSVTATGFLEGLEPSLEQTTQTSEPRLFESRESHASAELLPVIDNTA